MTTGSLSAEIATVMYCTLVFVPSETSARNRSTAFESNSGAVNEGSLVSVPSSSTTGPETCVHVHVVDDSVEEKIKPLICTDSPSLTIRSLSTDIIGVLPKPSTTKWLMLATSTVKLSPLPS